MVRVLVEGTSDVPTVREVFVRGLGQSQGVQFQVFWHRGKGKIPADPLAKPNPRDSSLLGQLPAKLRAFGKNNSSEPVVVLLDADRDDCRSLRRDLEAMLQSINPCPANVLLRIAVEELESWFLADTHAVELAYPHADIMKLSSISPDAVIGAWEALATALGLKPSDCTGADKEDWARDISPHLELKNPPSPTFTAFVRGLERLTGLSI